MRLNLNLTTAVSSLAVSMAVFSAPAFAQSTGSIDFDEIVVTGTRSGTLDVAGIAAPDTTKAKAVLTQEAISRQNPGQTILDTINQVPGVSFQNNDAYGSSGGTLSIRGFSSDRVSLTFDGVPLNDSGNYAIYSNQQFDPELIDQVNVNLGTTDVDSPTASAAGGTVNYRSITPTRDFGAMMSLSAGEFNFMRMFAKIETGELTPGGLRAWFAMSRATNDNPFNNYGKVNKQQYNAKLYQPLSGDDFISLAGHWNRNRNNFFGSLPLRTDAGRVVGSGSGNRYPTNADERRYLINYPCQVDAPQAGVADTTNSCGTEFDRRYNPSDTGNVRLSSRFSLSDKLVFTFDPSYQYVKANGGGTVTGREGRRTIGGVPYTGFIGGQYYFGTDLNKDGDTLDTCSATGAACSSATTQGVTLIAPSQTQTHRIGAIVGLRYDINDTNTVRINYTYDRARHRQTGQVANVEVNGEPVNVFAIDAALKTSDGFVMQKRDRLSYAILHQVSGEYRGEFLDDALVVNLGVRVPFFRRNLTNYCFTTAANGNLDCINPASTAAYAAANPTYAQPQQRILNYSKVLPNVGFTYKVTDSASVFGNFSQGLSVPGTDNLYNAFFFPVGTERAQPRPETTDNYDLGLRFRSGKIQAQVSGFYNQFRNRLASAFDPELNETVYRNLGNVKKYGVDGYVSFQPTDQIAFYAFGSVLKSEIADDLVIGENRDGSPIYARTAGKFESGVPKYSYGGSVNVNLDPVEFGFVAKRTGSRYIFDTNEAMYTGRFVAPGALNCVTATSCSAPAAATAATQIFTDRAPAYWLVNFDARLKLSAIGLNDKSFFQFNVYNLFNQFYVGGFGGGLNQSSTFCPATTTSGTCSGVPGGQSVYGSPPFVQIGAPRTISGSVIFAF